MRNCILQILGIALSANMIFALDIAMAAPQPQNGTEAAGKSQLKGTSWLVEDIQGKGVIDYAQTTVVFGHEGRVSGNTACNRYSGPVTIMGNELKFGALISTRRACPPAVMDQERKFLAAMEGVRSFVLDEKGLLHLRDANGNELLRLAAHKEK